MIEKIILAVLLLNTLSFIVARIWWGLSGAMAATMRKHVEDESDKTMTYLVAGNLNQPQPAFEFLLSEISPNYTYMEFDRWGWNAHSTADAIISDIREYGYEAKVITISVGDHVARYLEEELGDEIEIYSINPCSSRKALQPKWRALTSLALPVELLCHIIGWPTVIPFIPVKGGESYSLITLIDQYWTMAYSKAPLRTSGTSGILLSENDEFLKNDYLKELFDGASIVEVETSHADTIGSAEKYLEGMRGLLEP